MDGIDLWTVQIIMAPQGNILLRFKGQRSAEEAYAALNADTAERVEVADDFGYRMAIRPTAIVTRLLCHVVEMMAGERAGAMAQALAEAKLKRELQTSPALKIAQAVGPIALPAGRG